MARDFEGFVEQHTQKKRLEAEHLEKLRKINDRKSKGRIAPFVANFERRQHAMATMIGSALRMPALHDGMSPQGESIYSLLEFCVKLPIAARQDAWTHQAYVRLENHRKDYEYDLPVAERAKFVSMKVNFAAVNGEVKPEKLITKVDALYLNSTHLSGIEWLGSEEHLATDFVEDCLTKSAEYYPLPARAVLARKDGYRVTALEERVRMLVGAMQYPAVNPHLYVGG